MARGLRSTLAFLLALLCLNASPPGLAESPEEADVRLRLALLVNFARFVDWPENQGPRSKNHWRFCFARSDDAAVLRAADMNGESLYDMPIEVQMLDELDSVRDCHLLYLPANLSKAATSQLLKLSHYESMLTVSDQPGFARRSGMVEIVVENGRYQFEVGYGAVLDAGLKLDSGMLKLARRVY